MYRLLKSQWKFRSIFLSVPSISKRCISFRDYYHDDFSDFLSKQKILLRGSMVKHRTVHVPLPFSLKKGHGNNKYTFNFSLSNLAGHASFIFLAVSYLESDFLSLRLYAISGITMSIIFQYYRQIPLWIPIRWNTLFLLINTTMVVLLLIEENEAMNIPPDEIAILHNVFSNHGKMKAVDFRHLMSIATKHSVKKGEKIVSQGVENNHIHLVKSGLLSVQRDNKQIGSIGKYQFVGEMSFLSWEMNIGTQLNVNQNQLSKEHYNMWNISSLDSQLFQLPMLFDEEPRIENLLAPLSPMQKDKSIGKKEKSQLPDGELGHASVVCVEDCELYTWSFQELHDLMISQPSIGMIFEKTLATDLNKKMVGSWREEPRLRYKEVLSGILVDSEITDNKRRLLEKYREENGISYQNHCTMIEELGWTLEDFEVGLKGGPNKKALREYELKLEKLLLKQTKISENIKAELRELRKELNISGEVHIRLLRKMGWSLDDYEIGYKGDSKKTANQMRNQIKTSTNSKGLELESTPSALSDKNNLSTPSNSTFTFYSIFSIFSWGNQANQKMNHMNKTFDTDKSSTSENSSDVNTVVTNAVNS